MEEEKNKTLTQILVSALKRLLYFFGGILLTKKEYTVLQNDIKILREQLRVMIEEPDSFKGVVISKRHYMGKAMEEAMWFGDTSKQMQTVGISNLTEPKQI